MPATDDDLYWNSASLQNLLLAKNIRSRGELARRIHTSRAVVGDAFDEQWHGRATKVLITRLARYFHVPLNQLVIEPASISPNGNVNIRKNAHTK